MPGNFRRSRNRKIFDMGRSMHEHRHEVVITQDLHFGVDLSKAKGGTIVEFKIDPVDVESFRKMWEEHIERLNLFRPVILEEGMKVERIDIPKPKAATPYGNLYNRKLRIRK